MQPIKIALIDLDGTLVDSAPDIHHALCAALQELYAQNAYPLSLNEVRNCVGKGAAQLIKDTLQLFMPHYAHADHEKSVLAAFLKHYASCNGKYSRLYPNVIEGLQALHYQSIVLTCVTNKPSALAVSLCEQLQLHHFFKLILGGDDFPKKKPDPMPFVATLKQLNYEAKNAIVIGDSENDCLAAQAAHCRSLLLPYGYNHGKSVQNLPSDGIVPDMLAAAQWVAQQNHQTYQ